MPYSVVRNILLAAFVVLGRNTHSTAGTRCCIDLVVDTRYFGMGIGLEGSLGFDCTEREVRIDSVLGTGRRRSILSRRSSEGPCGRGKERRVGSHHRRLVVGVREEGCVVFATFWVKDEVMDVCGDEACRVK